MRSVLAVASVVLGLAAAPPAHGQAPGPQSLSGRVVLDGAGVPDVEVALHRVTPDTSGVRAIARTGTDGSFDFSLPAADTAGFTVYFVTADHRTVRYFGAPVHPGDSPEDYVVEVRDTTSAADGAVRMARRDLVLVPHVDGGWEINEVVRLRNTGSRTIVSRGGMPTWSMAIPAGVQEFEAGAGDLPTEQIQRMGDRVLLVAPIVPGDREIFLRYRIPGGRAAELATGSAMDSMNLFVQQPAPRVTVSGMRPVEVVTVEGRRYLQLTGSALAADRALRMEWERYAPPVDPVLAGVGAAVLLVLVGAGAAVRNRPR
jgi:hypothetical protein